ncbi:hypothetical protein CKM354_000190700 [Cercospora kikuchii]|uniref:HlyIII-domain-containing protein n=1 Tax=Cercospora kikuchii TaxID=84275 RepID=A0A9P3FDE9_9PEZI|nr:uncharacterized protein CKM354_000190700 [Cercospora kikuchii]GIZ38490.1 hypothetical protein CKM354_000190700 [Cercospora kikuchii]
MPPKSSPKTADPSSSKDQPTLLQKTEQKLSKTLAWAQIEPWQQDNHYITSHYRPASNSYSKSFHSILSLHNETINIWTHLLGSLFAILSSTFLYHSLKPRFQQATHQDVLVFACFFLGATVCLGMSATFHTISNHSAPVQKFGNRLDYMGIIFLIWGSFIPSIYYGFAREEALRRVYWSMITTIGAGTFIVIMHPKFRSSEWRPFRAAMFIMMGLSAIVPVLHGLKLYGLEQMQRQIGLSWLVLQGVLYITGAVIYAARVPERWKPGQFDLFGSSHQIFHVLVLLAAAAHLTGLLKAFDYEHRFRLDALLGAKV